MAVLRSSRAGALALLFAGMWHTWVVGAQPAASPATQPATAPVGPPHSVTGYRGAGSCSALACHGSTEPASRAAPQNEHTTWISQDKHANAYLILFTRRSESMASALGLGAAHQSERCLVCHTTPAYDLPRDVRTSDGVSCEACHGPAAHWLGPHTTVGWRGLPNTVKEASFGLVNTKDLARRAEICASCHVGEPARGDRIAREVNHDLIAAGHPPLRFEFSAYLALMKTHWVEKGRNADSDFPARAWMVGQLSSAKAALELLRSRAEQARVEPQRNPWPELAEYSCFSCHRALGPMSSSRKAVSRSIPWGAWHYMLPAVVVDQDSESFPSQVRAELVALKRLMEQTTPAADEIARRADSAARVYSRWLTSAGHESYGTGELRGLTSRVSLFGRGDTETDWDTQAQRYLALVALRQGATKPTPGSIGKPAETEDLVQLLSKIQFPRGSDSPPRLQRP